MPSDPHVPAYVTVVSVLLGCVDLLRGFMHTVRVEYAAGQVAGLDLSSPVAIDLLTLMTAFGSSNLLTGVMLILIGLRARSLALAMLGVIPFAYLLGLVGLTVNSASYAETQAAYPGKQMMAVYLTVCIATFIAASVQSRIRLLDRHERKESVLEPAASPNM